MGTKPFTHNVVIDDCFDMLNSSYVCAANCPVELERGKSHGISVSGAIRA